MHTTWVCNVTVPPWRLIGAVGPYRFQLKALLSTPLFDEPRTGTLAKLGSAHKAQRSTAGTKFRKLFTRSSSDSIWDIEVMTRSRKLALRHCFVLGAVAREKYTEPLRFNLKRQTLYRLGQQLSRNKPEASSCGLSTARYSAQPSPSAESLGSAKEIESHLFLYSCSFCQSRSHANLS